MPAIVIGLLLPIVLDAKVAVAALWSRVTVSLLSTPESAAAPFTRRLVADVVRSYSRLFAVIPVTVSGLAVTVPVNEGWVSE